MVGSLIIVDCEDMAAARTLAARDPYAKAGLCTSPRRPHLEQSTRWNGSPVARSRQIGGKP